MKSGAGGNWRRSDEKFDPSVVKQTTGISCLSALGEMLLHSREVSVSQEVIRDIIGEPAYVASLARAINHFDTSEDGLIWRGFPTTDESLETLLGRYKNWGVVLISDFNDRIGHAVFIAGRTRYGLIKVKDPYDQTSYEMTMEDFLDHWGGEVIIRWHPETR